MKKIIIVVVSLLSLSFAKAQQVKFGIKGGINLSTITGDNSSSFSSMIGANAGGFSRFAVAKQFSIQPEVVLSLEGAKFSINGVGGNMTGTYINVPVLAQYEVGSGFVLQSGIQIGLLLSAREKVDKQGSTSIKDQLKSTNFSWVIGSSYQPKEWPVGFDLRYNLGLSNINSNTAVLNHTSTWQIGVFYVFNKK